MKLKYNLENIGNIDKASITIKPLTIIAGENSSGKTFVTKSFYTLLKYVQFSKTNNIELQSSYLEDFLKKNFQTTKLQNLIKDNNSKSIKLSIDNIIKFEFNQQNSTLSLDKEFNKQIESMGNIIFFDSPIYVKIKKALQSRKVLGLNDDKYLKGYPEYIEDLYYYLEQEYIDISDFNNISLEIEEKINGKLNISNSGEIFYNDKNGNTIPISLTAMGISNIGIIDLLLRNNLISKNSFLIMDEPEVHLHPQWQVFLAQILYKIAKSGANIIIATHSLDFLKAFENILKEENEVAEDIIAINKMPYNEDFLKLSELEKVGIVLDDLSRPFYDLYMQDI
jgi:predicted ATPase